MFRILFLLATSLALGSAGGYGGGGGGRSSGYGGYGGSGGGGGLSNFASAFGFGSGGGGSTFSGGIIPAAIQSNHRIDFRDVPTQRDIQGATIEVGASVIPLNIIFKSASSNLNVLQQHEGAAGGQQETSSEDEPHRLLHTVRKPVIQEVREIVTPFRKVIQEIQPVQEEIQTIVARGTEIGRATSLGGLGLGGAKTLAATIGKGGGVTLDAIGLGPGKGGFSTKSGLDKGIAELSSFSTGKSGGGGGGYKKKK